MNGSELVASISDRVDGGILDWIFLLSPLLFLGSLVASLRIGIFGRRFAFDGATHTIMRNGRPVAPFSDVTEIRLRTLHSRRTADEYLLSLKLKNGESIRIVSHSNRAKIIAAADDIASVVGVSVARVT